MGNKGKHKVTYITMLVLMVLVILVGCAPQATPAPSTTPVTSKPKVEVLWVQLGDLTGTAGAGGTLDAKGVYAMMDWLNSQNYVPGVTLKAKVMDTSSDAAKSMAAYKQVMGETPKPVCLELLTSAIAGSVAGNIAADKIPSFCTGTPLALANQPPGYIFFYNPYYPNQAGCYIDWFMKNWKKSTPPTFAWLTWDIVSGRVMMSNEIDAYIKSKGIKVVPGEFIPGAPSDTTSNLARLKAAGVDFTYGGMQPEAAAVIYKDMDKLGMVGSMTVGWLYFMSLAQLINYVTPRVAEGSVVTTVFATTSELKQLPIAKALIKPAENLNDAQIGGILVGAKRAGIIAEGIRLAATKVGPDKVDSAAVYEALQTIKNFDPWGVSPLVSFSATNRIAAPVLWVQQAKDGQVVYADKAASVPDLLPGGKDVPK
jgi:ABC-type branched-subunit amino acid transport system substrate-binding protein